MLRHLVDSLARKLKKGVVSRDRPWVGACSHRSRGARMGLPATA